MEKVAVCLRMGGMGAKTGLYAVPVKQELVCMCNDEPLEVKEATKKGYRSIEMGGVRRHD